MKIQPLVNILIRYIYLYTFLDTSYLKVYHYIDDLNLIIITLLNKLDMIIDLRDITSIEYKALFS